METRRDFFEKLKARALEAKANNSTIKTTRAINNPMIAKLIERAKAQGITTIPMMGNNMSKELPEKMTNLTKKEE